jgi:organic hydroperoxide reductase OsmC/OhrA
MLMASTASPRSAFTPRLTLKSDSDIEVARTIMEKVEENCFIANSITSEVELVPQFRVVDGVR